MIILQRSPEWYREHVGKVTGSSVYRLMCGPRRRATFLREKADELIASTIHVNYHNEHMQFGIDNENRAIMEYELVFGEMTRPGYWIAMDGWGCTPDAFVIGEYGDVGLLSAKCTMLPHMMERRKSAPEPEVSHYWQCTSEMAATELPWCDIGTYCPFMPERDERLFTRRVERNETDIQRMLDAISSFNKDVDAVLRSMGHDPEELRIRAAEPLPVEYDDLERYMHA